MPTNEHVPLILIRGFGGLSVDDERQVAYQGFNEGTVYPHKRGENYIYEGLVLKYLKSQWQYHDATNVVGYYGNPVLEDAELPQSLRALDRKYFSGDRVVIDPGTALELLKAPGDTRKSLWVFRYYDLNARNFKVYGEALARLIDFVRDLTALKSGSLASKLPVNIIAHSMGGLIVRELVQVTLPGLGRRADECINKIVTLGTPHRGIAFQGIRDWKFTEAAEELERFNPDAQADAAQRWSYVNFAKHFPPARVLCVVGTNYRTVRNARRNRAEPVVFDTAGVRLELQPQRRSRQADVGAAAGRAANVHPQVPWRTRFGRDGTRVVRSGDALLSRGHPRTSQSCQRARHARAGSLR